MHSGNNSHIIYQGIHNIYHRLLGNIQYPTASFKILNHDDCFRAFIKASYGYITTGLILMSYLMNGKICETILTHTFLRIKQKAQLFEKTS